MKTFAEFGLKYIAKDGKKRFDCDAYSLGDLMNKTIEVIDFETGINTREGKDRYLILFNEKTIGEGKFFTASEELKQLLDKIKEQDGLPFSTIIQRKKFSNNKVKYIFT